MKALLLITGLLISIGAAGQKKIVVAQDGSGDFKTVQQAFDAIPVNNKKPVEVFVKKGVYLERVVLDSTKSQITLRGEDETQTILTFNNHNGIVLPDGSVISTPTSASVFIYASHFKAVNITFQNNAGFTAGQAVAVYAYGDKLIFNHCRFMGFQDVLYCSGPHSRQYYQDCYIEGTTDFIFGPSVAVFQNCLIHSKKNSHVTAAATPQNVKYGFVFFDCKLTGDTALHNVSLGRPWRPYASVTYIRCNMGPHILPEGWNNWKNPDNEKTARFAEYQSTGPGANSAARAKWARQLTAQQAKAYTLKNIFTAVDYWNPLNDR